MNDLLDTALGDAGDIGLLVHLGAGTGAILDSPGAANARDIVLAEADPAQGRRLAERIEAREETLPKVGLIAAAVGAADGTAAFRQFNLQPQSSLREPTDLRTLYPGLRQTGETEVQVIGIPTLLSRLPPAGDRPDVLVVDVPGEEETVISGLLEAGALERFGTVLLRCGTTAHYDGSATIDALGQKLETAGYRLAGQDDTDPDYPTRLYRPDRLGQENRRLAAALAAAQADMDTVLREAAARADAQTTKLTALEAEAAALRKQVETAEATARAAEESAKTEAAASLKKVEAAETQAASQRQKIAELERKHALARDDLRRAEGQIGIVKDLLLRGDPL